MTKLLFFEDTYLFEESAVVVDVIELNEDLRGKCRVSEECEVAVVLDQTIFYPQGGGQPADQGVIGGCFEVGIVKFNEGEVWHFGRFVEGQSFEKGDAVELKIEEGKRRLHAKLHSAGHLVDIAINNLGINLLPTKGFHFPAGPYVEYEWPGEAGDVSGVGEDLENEMNRLVAEGGVVTKELVSYERLGEVCENVPDYLPEGKPARILTMLGVAMPCGGTHVNDLKEIGGVKIGKISNKKGKVRVRYEVISG